MESIGERKAKKQKSLKGLIAMILAPSIAGIISSVLLAILIAVVISKSSTIDNLSGDTAVAGLFIAWLTTSIAAGIIALIFYIIGLVKIAAVKDGKGEHSGFATAGFILSICGMQFLGLIFGAIALGKNAKNRGMAVSAVTISVASIVVGVIVAIVVSVGAIGGAFSSDYNWDEIEDSIFTSSERKNAVNEVSSALSDYSSENEDMLPASGSYSVNPTSESDFSEYLQEVFGGIENVKVKTAKTEGGTTKATKTTIEIFKNASCYDEGTSSSKKYVYSGYDTDAAIFVKLGDGKYFCENF